MPIRFLITCLLALSAGACGAAVLTLAEQPVRLIRGATLYRATAGVAVQKDDILETGAAGAQVEAGPKTIVALGPHTRVLVGTLAVDDKSATDVALLEGWVKVLAKAGKCTQVATPALLVTLVSGSTIVRAGGAKDAVFAEEGEQAAARIDDKGKAGPPLKLPAEQYAAIDSTKPQPAPGRPARDFLAALPPSFRDGLQPVPRVPNAGKVAPVKEHDVEFADVQAWLGAPASSFSSARAGFVARFKPRLSDAAFRKALDAAFGDSAEWKAILHPPRPSPAASAPQQLFRP